MAKSDSAISRCDSDVCIAGKIIIGDNLSRGEPREFFSELGVSEYSPGLVPHFSIPGRFGEFTHHPGIN